LQKAGTLRGLMDRIPAEQPGGARRTTEKSNALECNREKKRGMIL